MEEVPKNALCGPSEWTEVVRKGVKAATPPLQQGVKDKVAAKLTEKQPKQQQQKQ